MSQLSILGALFLLAGGYRLFKIYKWKQWPVVKGTLDSVDVKIDATGYSKGVGFFVKPRYIHKVKYLFHGNQYVITFSENKVIPERPDLRVNPQQPSEAFLDQQNRIIPVLAVAFGLLCFFLTFKAQTNQ